MLSRLLSWFIFSVIIGLSPLLSSCISLFNRSMSISFEALIGKGELYLFVAAISAGALGELLTNPSSKRWINTFAGGAAVIILFECAYSYADIYSELNLVNDQQKRLLTPERIVDSSLFFLAMGVFISSCCIGVSTNNNNKEKLDWR